MGIFMAVIQLLSLIAPMMSRVLAAKNESQAGGIRDYDRLLTIASQELDHIAATDLVPGEHAWENQAQILAKLASTTFRAAQAAGMLVKDHQIWDAATDALTAWKMFRKTSVDVPILRPDAATPGIAR